MTTFIEVYNSTGWIVFSLSLMALVATAVAYKLTH
jgi:hypothetical protein